MIESSQITVVNSDVQQHSFKWTIVNFSKISEQYYYDDAEGTRKDPPISRDIRVASSAWKLYIYPKYRGSAEFVGFYLKKLLRDASIYQVETIISIIDSDGNAVHSSGSISIDTNWHLVLRKLLLDQKQKYLPNDTLTMKCHFEVLPKFTLTDFEGEFASSMNTQASNICSDFMALLNSQSCSDMTLRCNDCEFPAHKAILAARSPVFCKMFQHDMLENRMNIVDIPDIEAPTLKELLHYIYGKKIEETLPQDICLELYEAADKYELPQLVQHCASIMAKNLSLETVCNVAVLAHLHSDSYLFAAAKSFVKNNLFVSQLIISETWVDFVQKSPGTASRLIAS